MLRTRQSSRRRFRAAFGGNGLAFDAAGKNLYIANTADDRILKYNLALALTGAVGDEPEEDVSTYTVSRIRLDHGD